ncbi:MAG: large subunit ribosomal protein L18 [Candidatus Peregrinibacteria bacterium Greene0416_62]|nr:MAG: large subunit ribosomal protein L18 [Candidatus Peregrinibacteria bacterium Greene0416_62]TSC98637.1 MAG: large subunit ribosomal protein L18 [Candidatus Peregrinibacteria bacterium Greene1014_49]
MRHPKFTHRLQRKKRIRSTLSGTAACPRLTVYRSHTRITAQMIDDTTGKTIVAGSTTEAKGKPNKEGAKKLGALVAAKAQEKKITTVVFDRNGYKYHGCIKEVADAAREAGLKF